MSVPRASVVDWIAPLRWISGLLFLLIVVLTIAQVVWRFALNNPLVWSDEVARLLLIWMTFVTAAVVTYDGTHLCVDTFFAAMGALDISLAWYRAPTAVGGVLIVATLALRWLYLVKRIPRRRDEAGIDVVDTL